MVMLRLIWRACGLSDDQICAQWLENASFEVFSDQTVGGGRSGVLPFTVARRPARARGRRPAGAAARAWRRRPPRRP